MAISLGDARAVVQNMKQQYAAFERMEEALTLVESAEQLVNELNLRRSQIDEVIGNRIAEIQKLDAVRDGLKQQIESDQAKILSLKKETAETIAEHRATVKSSQVSLEKAKAEVNQRLKELRAYHDDVVVGLQKTQDEEKLRIVELQTVFAALKGKLASL